MLFEEFLALAREEEARESKPPRSRPGAGRTRKRAWREDEAEEAGVVGGDGDNEAPAAQ